MNSFWMRLMTPAVLILSSSGCAQPVDRKKAANQSFGLREIRQLAMPIVEPSAETGTTIAPDPRRQALRVATIYSDALLRFDGIYGNGVGTARNDPDFVRCRKAFHEVEKLTRSTKDIAPSRPTALANDLAECRRLAQEFRLVPEVATFGNDLLEISLSSILTLRLFLNHQQSNVRQ